MTDFYVWYTLKDKAARDGFYKEIKEAAVAEKSLAEEGCLRYDYYFPAEADHQIFLWERWESRQAQKVHTTKPHFKIVGSLKEKYQAETEVIIEDRN